MQLVLVTGLSGSGKSIAIRVLEDDGFFCVDNLPLPFVGDVVKSLRDDRHQRVAVAVDARSHRSLEGLRETLGEIQRSGIDLKVIFLDARTETLVQRFSETRRRHPLSATNTPDAADSGTTLVEAIERERELLSVLGGVGVSIDTSDLLPNVLRQWVRDTVGAARAPLTLLFESFAYKHGVPLNADLVFDARCLPNPYYSPELRPLDGRDAPVADFLAVIPSVRQFADDVTRFVRQWLPSYIQEHRSYLTVAIGCTGGQHRSVWLVEELARRFRLTETVLIRHRARSQHDARR